MAKTELKVSEDARHTLFLEIIGMLWRYNDAGLQHIAAQAGCHWVTLYSWKSGRTTAPRLDKIAAVALALGYELKLVRKGAQRVRMQVVK